MGSHQLHGLVCYVIGQQMSRHPSFAKSHPRTKCRILLMQPVGRNVSLGILPEWKLTAPLMASKSSRRRYQCQHIPMKSRSMKREGDEGMFHLGYFFL